MDPPTVVMFLSKPLDRLSAGPVFYTAVAIANHKETSSLLAACGYNTEELDSAITAAEGAFKA